MMIHTKGEPRQAEQSAFNPPHPVQTIDSGARAVGLASLGAFMTALAATACCWLPPVLVGLGISAAGVGALFERYQPLLLGCTFTLLALAWALSYRASLRRLWARQTGHSVPIVSAESCCVSKAKVGPVSWFRFSKEQSIMISDDQALCSTDPATIKARGSPQATTDQVTAPVDGEGSHPGLPPERWITWGSCKRVMLGVGGGMILLSASFPLWSGPILGEARTDSCCVRLSPTAPAAQSANGADPCCSIYPGTASQTPGQASPQTAAPAPEPGKTVGANEASKEQPGPTH